MGTRTDGSPDRLPRYDRAYKKLFTQPEMVEELLRGFLREDWAAGLDLDEPHLAGNRVAALFRLETQGSPENAPFLMEDVATLISPEREPELWSVVEVWMRAVLRRICPEGIITPERITPEDFPMIYDNFRKWFADARKEGRQEGLQQGRKEGQVEALQKAVLRMLSKRFGPLPLPVSQKVERISSVRRLQDLLDRTLEVGSLQELRLQ